MAAAVTFSLIKQSIADNTGYHVASAATVSAGVAEKIIETGAISTFDMIVSGFGTAAVIIAPIFTLYLFYSKWKQDRLDTELKLILLAKEGRRIND